MDGATAQVEAQGELARLATLPDLAIDLAEAALALSVIELPLRDRNKYRIQLMDIAGAVAERAVQAETAAQRAALLAEVIQDRGQFRCDEQEDALDPVNLITLLDNRRGPSLLLALLWLDAGRRQGWSMAALTFPGHALIRLDDENGGRVVVDPAAGGLLLDAHDLRDLLKAQSGLTAELEPGHYADQANREVLLTLLTVNKLRCLRLGQVRRASEALETALLLAPHKTSLWREMGLMQLRLGEIRDAIRALERFVAEAPNSVSRHRTTALLQELRDRMT